MRAGPFGGMVSSISIHPSDPRRIYAGVFGTGVFGTGVFGAGVYRSDDGGTLWTAKSRGLTDTGVYSVLALPAGGTVLAATNTGVFRSVDGGESWKPSNDGLPDTGVRMFAPLSESHILAATGSGVFRSRDGGKTWADASEGLTNPDVRWLTVEPDAKRRIFAATFGGLFESRDGGRTWREKGLSLPPLRTAVVAAGGRTVIAGSANRGAFISLDGGTTFKPANEGLPSPYIMALGFSAAAGEEEGAGGSPPLFLAGTLGGLYVSRNGGSRWNYLSSDMTNLSITAFAVHPKDPKMIFAATGGLIFRTADGGRTWTNQARWVIHHAGRLNPARGNSFAGR